MIDHFTQADGLATFGLSANIRFVSIVEAVNRAIAQCRGAADLPAAGGDADR